jgi:endonuclease YncB( thermonuclease family)
MRRFPLAVLFVCILLLGGTFPVLAQDLDCGDFGTQGAAQAVYDADPSDPHGLDGPIGPNSSGVPGLACESLPGGGGGGTSSGNTSAGSSDSGVTQQISAAEPEPTRETAPTTKGASAQGDPSCADFDAYEWAQSVFESDPKKYDALDPDGDGQVCPELPRGGFAPAFWLNDIPKDVEEAEIIRIVDGDTFEVLIDGVSNRVRIYRADTPETQNEQECGGQEATDFAEYALSFNDDEDGKVFLERDKNERDRYGRELAYVWFEVDGAPYMLNHILINNGWANDVDYGDRKYDDELKDAAAFAKRNELGVWGLCEGFGQPLPEPAPTDVPAAEQPAQQPQVEQPAQQPQAEQPAQETQAGQPVQSGQPAAPVELEPEYVEPEPEAPVQEEAASGCDPNYSPCIPAFPPDLDCGEIGITVTVTGGDPHGLDRDNDGIGCE